MLACYMIQTLKPLLDCELPETPAEPNIIYMNDKFYQKLQTPRVEKIII